MSSFIDDYNKSLYHYGVLGMKWGVRKANRKISTNEKLKKKALNYDKKAAQLTKKSEKVHTKIDLEGSNRKAIKAANWDKRAAKLEKKALNSTDDGEKLRLERRSENLKYKAAKARIDADRISKTSGYGREAMKYSIKSDKVTAKAAKARKHISNNKAYIEMMNRKISSLSEDDLRGAYLFVNELKGA